MFVTKIIVEEFVIDADTKEDAEYDAMQKAENSSDPDGSEIETITVNYAELDRSSYLQDEIDFLEEEVL